MRKSMTVAVCASVAAGLAALGMVTSSSAAASGGTYAVNPPYRVQLSRNAEWDGLSSGDFTATQMQTIADNNSYFVIDKIANKNDITKHFAQVKTIYNDAKKDGHTIKIFDYYANKYWLTGNGVSDGNISDFAVAHGLPKFDDSWLLTDASGHEIGFCGEGNIGCKTPIGDMIDVGNPAYRNWLESVVKIWVKQAPYSGMAFDTTDEILGKIPVLNALSVNTNQTWNQLFCGAQASNVDSNGNCPRVAAWDSGLATLMRQMTTMLAGMRTAAGAPYETLYNGVADNVQRGPSRNTGLLADADATSDENFCYPVHPGKETSTPNFVSFTGNSDGSVGDLQLMRNVKASGKKIFEITNSQGLSERTAYGNYCLAGFLMGWLPGSSYYIYHDNYFTAYGSTSPQAPEQNLNLGNPTAAYQTSGNVLSRTFDNGFVAVNTGNSNGEFTIPATATEFNNGSAVRGYQAGATITVAPHSAAFFLNESYLHPKP